MLDYYVDLLAKVKFPVTVGLTFLSLSSTWLSSRFEGLAIGIGSLYGKSGKLASIKNL